MDWTQALTVIGVFIGGFIYLISKIDTNQKENNTRFNGIENRLTALEVEIKNIQQRLSTIEGYLIPRKFIESKKLQGKNRKKTKSF